LQDGLAVLAVASGCALLVLGGLRVTDLEHGADEHQAGCDGEEHEAHPEERPGDSQVAAAREQARDVAEIGLVGGFQPVDLRDDVQDRRDDQQDAEQSEGTEVLVRIADDLDAQRPEQEDDRQRCGDRQTLDEVQVRHEEQHAESEGDDQQRVAEEDVRQPPHVTPEAEGQRLQEPHDRRAGEVQDQGERPDHRQDGGDRQDEPSGRAIGQGRREVVGIERLWVHDATSAVVAGFGPTERRL
jgi:hypothetical protein